MNKTELINAVAKNAELSRKDADKAVSAAFDAIVAALKAGEKVQIVGFGAFEAKERAARTARNPRTGEEIKIETVDTDGPDFVFNKCTENEMLFCDAGHDEFEHCMDNDYVPWILALPETARR